MQWSHQIDVDVREMMLWHGDWQGLKADMAVNPALLTAEARSRPCRDVAGQTAPDESRQDGRRQASRDEKCCVNLRKYLDATFAGQWDGKRPLKHPQPGGECLLGERQV